MGSLPPVTTEAIALTEKKMDMTLDDIIKMSKKTTVKAKSQRTSNKSQRVFSKYRARDNISKANIQRSINAKSSAMRQGKLAELRSRNGPNQLIAVKEAARRAAVAPIRARTVQWNKRRSAPLMPQISRPFNVSSPKINGTVKQRPSTLDSLFANMKEQRMRAQAQTGGRPRNFVAQQRNFVGRQRNFIGQQRNFMDWQRSN